MIRRALVLAAVLVLAAAAWFWWGGVATWAQHFFGFVSGGGNGSHYLFWSGSGSDLAELTLLGALGGMWHKHNCHKERCWRIGKHLVEGTPWCNRHHTAARSESLPAPSPVEKRLDTLIESIDGLADAIRTAMLTGRR